MVRLKGLGVRWRRYCNHCTQRVVWRNRAKHCCSGDTEIVISGWVRVSSEMATGCELMKVQCWWETGKRLICICDMEIWALRHPLRDKMCCHDLNEMTGNQAPHILLAIACAQRQEKSTTRVVSNLRGTN